MNTIDIMRMSAKLNESWGAAMLDGHLGIVPEDKIKRVSKAGLHKYLETTDQNYRDEEAKLDPFELFGHKIKRSRQLKIVGCYISHNSTINYQQYYLLDKLSHAWSGTCHQMNRSRFFSLKTWIKLWRSKVLSHVRF